jgi:hypothetical protein
VEKDEKTEQKRDNEEERAKEENNMNTG